MRTNAQTANTRRDRLLRSLRRQIDWCHRYTEIVGPTFPIGGDGAKKLTRKQLRQLGVRLPRHAEDRTSQVSPIPGGGKQPLGPAS